MFTINAGAETKTASGEKRFKGTSSGKITLAVTYIRRLFGA